MQKLQAPRAWPTPCTWGLGKKLEQLAKEAAASARTSAARLALLRCRRAAAVKWVKGACQLLLVHLHRAPLCTQLQGGATQDGRACLLGYHALGTGTKAKAKASM